MAVSAQHEHFLARAIELAREGWFTTRPNPRVGAVVVRDGTVVGEGAHRRAGEAHAEVEALQAAGDLAEGATVYVSLEPCAHHGRTPPCVKALIDAKIKTLVFGSQDPNPLVAGAGVAALEDHGIEVIGPLLETAARALNPGYTHRHTTQLPRVVVKCAMTLDGRTGLRDGRSKWITSSASRADVQRLRAESGAIMTGIGTVIADDPKLTVRDARFRDVPPPVRVIIDSKLKVPVDSALISDRAAPTLIFTTAATAEREQERIDSLHAVGVEVLAVPAVTSDDSRVPLEDVLRALAAREVSDLLVEAGPRLSGAILAADLCNQLVIYASRGLIGHTGQAVFNIDAPPDLNDLRRFERVTVRRVGPDLRYTYDRITPS